MKKLAKILTAAALCVAALTTFGCGDDKKEAAKAPAGDAPIKIAVTAGPHAEIMDNVKKLAEKQGLKIEVVEFNDYVTPNVALFQGEVFANSMQHRPYLDATLQKEPKFDLVEVFKTVNFPMAAYSKTLKKGDAIPAALQSVFLTIHPTAAVRFSSCQCRADQSQRYQKRYYHRCRYHRKST